MPCFSVGCAVQTPLPTERLPNQGKFLRFPDQVAQTLQLGSPGMMDSLHHLYSLQNHKEMKKNIVHARAFKFSQLITSFLAASETHFRVTEELTTQHSLLSYFCTVVPIYMIDMAAFVYFLPFQAIFSLKQKLHVSYHVVPGDIGCPCCCSCGHTWS